MNIGEEIEEIEFDTPFEVPAPIEPAVPQPVLEPV